MKNFMQPDDSDDDSSSGGGGDGGDDDDDSSSGGGGGGDDSSSDEEEQHREWTDEPGWRGIDEDSNYLCDHAMRLQRKVWLGGRNTGRRFLGCQMEVTSYATHGSSSLVCHCFLKCSNAC
jgi:hypothetical protein